MIKQNLALLCTLKAPILLVDPVQVALEYLDLFHSASEKITLAHIGDPEFQDQFNVEGKESDVSIINHSTLDLKKFNSMIELGRIKPSQKASIDDETGKKKYETRKAVFYQGIAHIELTNEEIHFCMYNHLVSQK